jgi:hypothetical protein
VTSAEPVGGSDFAPNFDDRQRAPNADIALCSQCDFYRGGGLSRNDEADDGALKQKGGRSRPFSRLDVSYMPFGLNATTAF